MMADAHAPPRRLGAHLARISRVVAVAVAVAQPARPNPPGLLPGSALGGVSQPHRRREPADVLISQGAGGGTARAPSTSSRRLVCRVALSGAVSEFRFEFP